MIFLKPSHRQKKSTRAAIELNEIYLNKASDGFFLLIHSSVQGDDLQLL